MEAMLIVSETVDHASAVIETGRYQLLYEFTWFAAHIFLPIKLRYLTATKSD